MSRIEERLKSMKVDTSEMTTEEKFTAATGLTHYDEETAANDWYVPGGVANVLTDGFNDGETYSAAEAAAYNATLEGAIQEGDDIADVNSTVNYELINNSTAWGNSTVLAKYYENNPNEDRWNVTENRAANFNDKVYEVEIGNGIYEFNAHWESDSVQKITNVNDSTEVYYLDMFYTRDENDHELFTDAAMTVSANKTARFRNTKWSDVSCPQCWEGAINAPGAKLPWVTVSFDEDVNAKVRFDYEGKDSVYPWGNTIFGTGEGHKEWGIASVAEEFGDDTFKLEVLGGENAFDTTKFNVVLVRPAAAEQAAAYNAKLDGAVKAGDLKPQKPSEIEVETEP